MSIIPEPSISRGEVTLQPGYFTSSLYVDPLREDLATLITSFAEQYNPNTRPFELFKKLWKEQGWSWLHLRVHDGRSRQSFLKVTERLFIDHFGKEENTLARVVALFALYTFHQTQPSTSAPPILTLPHITIPIDLYQNMLSLPAALDEPNLRPLKPYVSHVLSTMLEARAFLILPHSSLKAENPSKLPREIVVRDEQEALNSIALQEQGAAAPPKKKGRPSKRDKIRKAREALTSLEKYVDRTYVALPENPSQPQPYLDPTGQNIQPVQTGHSLFAQAPLGSLGNYVARKNELLSTLLSDAPDGPQDAALRRANEAVLARLKQIDEMAAEKGLEVGGEGGDKTGLARVEKAVDELRKGEGVGAVGGILSLLDGAGMEPEPQR
ncbi:hypothetical protein C8Q77DRAFT_1081655 [Trametes polyzona]|nr:hypothetical protein C8Q77DRAFT_1081655 [Trametes polyzona]